LSGFSEQSIAAGCYCIVKAHSNYVNFKMLVEFALRGHGDDDDGGFEVRSCPQSAFLVFWDLIPIYLSRPPERGCMTGALPPCLLKWGA